MPYYVTLSADGSVIELFDDTILSPPFGAIKINDLDASVIINAPVRLFNYDKTTGQLTNIAKVKADRIALMDSTYETLEHAPIAYMGTTFQADEYSQDLIAKTLAALGGATPIDFGWWDINNARVLMTNAQLQGLGQAIFARNQPLYINKQTKKAAIRAALTVAAVEAIIW